MKCSKNAESNDPRSLKTERGKLMLLSKCAVFGCKKSKFHKDQAASGLLLGPNLKMFYYWGLPFKDIK